MSLRKIFIINLILGLFGLLAHVPVLVMKLMEMPGFAGIDLTLVYSLLPLDFILAGGSVIALLGTEQAKLKILPIQAVALGVLSTALLGMLLRFIFIGLPGGRVSWTPGLGAAIVGFSASVLKRAFYKGDNKYMTNIGWYTAGGVFFFELTLMYKLFSNVFS